VFTHIYTPVKQEVLTGQFPCHPGALKKGINECNSEIFYIYLFIFTRYIRISRCVNNYGQHALEKSIFTHMIYPPL